MVRNKSTHAPEEWKEIEGYPGYRVSDLGRVQTKRHKNGLPADTWRDMKPVPDGHNYPQVRLRKSDEKPRWFFISSLVLAAFVGPRPSPKHVARHFYDPDPWNNEAKNLRWGTQAENCADKMMHGTDQSGERHWRAIHAKMHDSEVDGTGNDDYSADQPCREARKDSPRDWYSGRADGSQPSETGSTDVYQNVLMSGFSRVEPDTASPGCTATCTESSRERDSMPRKATPWYRTATGRWYVTIQGKQTPLPVTDPNDTTAAWAAFRAILEAAKAIPTGRPEPISAIVAEYLDNIAHRIAPKTKKDYAICLRWLVARFGEKCIGQIDPMAVEKCAVEEKWSDSHRSNMLWTAQAFARWAGRKDFTLSRPAKESRGADSVISPELHTNVLRQTTGDFHQYIRFLWATGCRPMEAAGLTVEMMDWPTGTVTLRVHKLKHKGRRRILYLSNDAIAILREQTDRHGSGHLFRGLAGRPFTRQAVVTRFLRVSEKVGHTVTAYCYRHSWATRALQNGLSDTHVATLLGHASTSMVHKHYAHLGANATLLRDVANRAAG